MNCEARLSCESNNPVRKNIKYNPVKNMRAQLHYLELTYPPISNQEAEWVKSDPEVISQIANSNLYFIGQKPETFFKYNDDVNARLSSEFKIYFTYFSCEKIANGYIDLEILFANLKCPVEIEFEVELGNKMIRIWTAKEAKMRVLGWFTTDKILFDKSRGVPFIKGLDDYKDFLVYNLHYVGISKKNSSFERLIVKPHDKRLRILSNEHPMNNGSRVSNEIVLFFFEIRSLEVKQYLKIEDFDEIGKNELGDPLRIAAEAEKAFVKIMNTEYNEVKFDNFPFSSDGMYNTSVERLIFTINEDFTFVTAENTICGARSKGYIYEEGDFIAISKISVELIKRKSY